MNQDTKQQTIHTKVTKRYTVPEMNVLRYAYSQTVLTGSNPSGGDVCEGEVQPTGCGE